ncbi:methylase [Mucor mucedo]|uniref:methylase n=1 Tax=Mucor mucedo TaxID=29922 RepID=UPI00221EDF43|nr:methylase [Mucor mucedo]KAI7892754.1 methylase [Mucor mucedo]
MNEYDNPEFFEKYSQMARSKFGLSKAGEWHELKKMLPDFNDKRVLDMGCGYGWHCIYAAEHGAASVLGVDSSVKMVSEARSRTDSPIIKYTVERIEEIDYPIGSFDVVISSLAFHYVASFDDIVLKVKKLLDGGGDFVFSVENPIFTSYGTGDWYYNEKGEPLHWPVDNYFSEGIRKANFLGTDVFKYHKTMSTYINTLIKYGFTITQVTEPLPQDDMIQHMPNELRRPMMLLISAKI